MVSLWRREDDTSSRCGGGRVTHLVVCCTGVLMGAQGQVTGRDVESVVSTSLIIMVGYECMGYLISLCCLGVACQLGETIDVSCCLGGFVRASAFLAFLHAAVCRDGMLGGAGRAVGRCTLDGFANDLLDFVIVCGGAG